MNLGEFSMLLWASKICNDRFPFLRLVDEWDNKRQLVAMYVRDIPQLVDSYLTRWDGPHRGDTRIVEFDALPGLRLASACEGLANCVYALCEIAASFASKSSGKDAEALPSSFNLIQKKVRDGKLSEGLFDGIANLEWYARIREIRTEWTHHSSVFIGQDETGPLIVVRPLRRNSDRVMLPEQAVLTVRNLLEWAEKAVMVVDRFGLKIFLLHVLPRMDLDLEITALNFDSTGFPILRSDGKLESRRETVREYLKRGGMMV